MGKVKQKMVDDAAGKKAAQEARRQRDLKRFGKQVQVAKEQERAKEKRRTLEKIDLLKRSESLSFFSPSWSFGSLSLLPLRGGERGGNGC